MLLHSSSRWTLAVSFLLSLAAISVQGNRPLVMTSTGVTISIDWGKDGGVMLRSPRHFASSTVHRSSPKNILSLATDTEMDYVFALRRVVPVQPTEDADVDADVNAEVATGLELNRFSNRLVTEQGTTKFYQLCSYSVKEDAKTVGLVKISCHKFELPSSLRPAFPTMYARDGTVLISDIDQGLFVLQYDVSSGVVDADHSAIPVDLEPWWAKTDPPQELIAGDVMLLSSSQAVVTVYDGEETNSIVGDLAIKCVMNNFCTGRLYTKTKFPSPMEVTYEPYLDSSTDTIYVFRSDMVVFDPTDQESMVDLLVTASEYDDFGCSPALTTLAVNQEQSLVWFAPCWVGSNHLSKVGEQAIYAFDISEDPLSPELAGYVPTLNSFDPSSPAFGATQTFLASSSDHVGISFWLSQKSDIFVESAMDLIPFTKSEGDIVASDAGHIIVSSMIQLTMLAAAFFLL